MESDEIEYRFVHGQGWVAGYKTEVPIAYITGERTFMMTMTEFSARIGQTIVYMPRSVMYLDGI